MMETVLEGAHASPAGRVVFHTFRTGGTDTHHKNSRSGDFADSSIAQRLTVCLTSSPKEYPWHKTTGIRTTQTKISIGPDADAAASSTSAEHQHGRHQVIDPRRGAFGGCEEQSLGPDQTDRCHLFRFDLRSQCLPGTAGAATMTAGASTSGGQSQRHYTVKPGDTLSKISRAVLWRRQPVHEDIQRKSQYPAGPEHDQPRSGTGDSGVSADK